ncbi:MAG TPA: GGDEF domain-containing protein [Euzebyales bacterium]|nr:GGDEF domain-containing protein [Euzebyales bacterium]
MSSGTAVGASLPDRNATVRTPRIWQLITTIAMIVYFGASETAQSAVYLLISVLAAVIVLAVPGRTSDAALGWRCIGVGWLLSAGGDAIWTWHELVSHTPPFPSVADIAYLSGYVAYAAGLLMLARAVGRRDTGTLLDAVVVAIGAGVIAWVTLATPYTNDASLSLAARAVSIAYPACDVLLLTLLLRLLFAGPTQRHRALLLLAISFILTLAADLGFAWTSLQGTYVSGHVVDAGWLLAFMFVGTAALHPSARVIAPAEQRAPGPLLPWSRLVLLAVSSLVAPALVVSAGVQRVDSDLMMVGAASGVLFLLVLWRMAGLVRQISLQAAELDALSTTDPLTGVANRRRWDAELRIAVTRAQQSGHPLTVVLLDLDRFKTFNDTFGHLAGDTLLQQATAAWQAQLRPGDLLARIGGEEFAMLLVGCHRAEAHTVVERLRAATPSEQTCSAGIATLEITDVHTSVIERADAALYRAKAEGRNRTAVAPSITAIAT